MSIHFQNHPGTKPLYGGFCPAFAGISGIRHCRDRTKNAPGSYKQNKKWLYFYHSLHRPDSYFNPSRFSYKQPLRKNKDLIRVFVGDVYIRKLSFLQNIKRWIVTIKQFGVGKDFSRRSNNDKSILYYDTKHW